MKLVLICTVLFVAVCLTTARRGRGPGGRGPGRRDCHFGLPVFGECENGEYSITVTLTNGASSCPPTKEDTGICREDSTGTMVRVSRQRGSDECFYTVPDFSVPCDETSESLTVSRSLVSGVDCEDEIQTTIPCKPDNSGNLMPSGRHIKKMIGRGRGSGRRGGGRRGEKRGEGRRRGREERRGGRGGDGSAGSQGLFARFFG